MNVGLIPPVTKLTYLGIAIRMELLRSSIEGAAGDKQVAQAIIVNTLQRFKDERGIA